MDVVTTTKQELHALWSDGKGPSLVAISSGWGILLGTRMIYPVVLPYIRSEFGISLATAGLLVTVLWMGSAVGQLPGGVLADRYSERFVMTVGTVLVAGALALVVTAATLPVIFLTTALVGLGQSLYPIARITILTEIYPDRIGSSLGVTMATGDLGQTVLPPIASAVAAAVAWQAGLGFMIPLLLLVGVFLWVALPNGADVEATGDSLSLGDAGYVVSELRQANMGFVGLILFLYILIWQSFTGLYPTYLVENKQLSSATAGLLFSAFFAFGVVIKPIAGAAYDRIGIKTALVAVLVGPVVGLALLPVTQGFWPLVGITGLISTMLGSGAITQSFLSDVIPGEIQGTGLGVVRTVTAVLGALGPVLFGSLADNGYFDEGYLLLAAILAVVILLTVRLPAAADRSASGGRSAGSDG